VTSIARKDEKKKAKEKKHQKIEIATKNKQHQRH
jgi:hypothetical protein